LLLCVSTGRATLADMIQIRQTKGAERRDKVSAWFGKQWGLARLHGDFRITGDVEKTPTGCERKAT
jgi:hypothetical protein